MNTTFFSVHINSFWIWNYFFFNPSFAKLCSNTAHVAVPIPDVKYDNEDI
jgi:hypothetical protein